MAKILQIIIVKIKEEPSYPDKNAVISMVAECRNGEELMSALYDLVCAKL